MDIHWFDIINISMIFIFLFGFVYNVPYIFIQINFFIKVLISFYLMYKFNDFTSTPIKFTILDKKICYSAGLYIFLFSFADVINLYFIELRTLLINKIEQNNYTINNNNYGIYSSTSV